MFMLLLLLVIHLSILLVLLIVIINVIIIITVITITVIAGCCRYSVDPQNGSSVCCRSVRPISLLSLLIPTKIR